MIIVYFPVRVEDHITFQVKTPGGVKCVIAVIETDVRSYSKDIPSIFADHFSRIEKPVGMDVAQVTVLPLKSQAGQEFFIDDP